MKKYSCPHCSTTAHVIRKTKRGDSIRYFCKACERSFSVNTHWINQREVLSDHLDGLSFRTLAVKYGMSPMKVWRICQEALQKLPNNNQFTYQYCERFSKRYSCLMESTSLLPQRNMIGCFCGGLITFATTSLCSRLPPLRPIRRGEDTLPFFVFSTSTQSS